MTFNIEKLIADGGFYCGECGKFHAITVKKYICRHNALDEIPSQLEFLGAKKPYILCDVNTYKASGEKICSVLKNAGIEYGIHIINRDRPVPDERTLGEALMYYTKDCDGIIGVGGGVINDTCKLTAYYTSLPYIYCPTAVSMDGYCSDSSSVEREGFKISLKSHAADIVIADTAVLVNAPKDMTLSGIGDMAAKYIALAEWKMANIITGESYCRNIADMVSQSLNKIVDNAVAAVNGDENAIAAVAEGMVISGLSMTCAGKSRPASGMEHYISHIRDMRGVDKGTRTDFHGIQCGFAVIPCLKMYEKLQSFTFDRNSIEKHCREYDIEGHNAKMREFVGNGADRMIDEEERTERYSLSKHKARLDNIISHWDELVGIMKELPNVGQYLDFCHSIGFPTECSELGMTDDELDNLFAFAADVRDKYVLGNLLWDIGIKD